MYRVVYVDRRVNQERDLQRDDQLPIVAPSSIADGDPLFCVDDDEVVSNLQAVLSVFTEGGSIRITSSSSQLLLTPADVQELQCQYAPRDLLVYRNSAI